MIIFDTHCVIVEIAHSNSGNTIIIKYIMSTIIYCRLTFPTSLAVYQTITILVSGK